ncbi:DUF4331 family protein [Novosphingobium sp.]|uniref:DUF4331 family protein n=1 Tax=Novosphingobium sp. TaxID=1874826 RepID=UPI0025FB1CA1|nr:DUF4331 family protein [Novosphingobium sp.]
MTRISFKFRRAVLMAPLGFAMATLSGCGNDYAAPTPTPSASVTGTAASFDVTPCLNQTIPGTGLTVAQAVLPDTLKLNLNAPSGFPNGRTLTDPVIDVTLAVIFLNLSKNSPATLAGLPLNPPANDLPFKSAFPYLADPQGTPPRADTTGTSFDFRTDADSAYTRVDRMGMPAVATALIGSSMKTAYNDANPSDDAAGKFVPEITSRLTALATALNLDFYGAGLSPCAVAK